MNIHKLIALIVGIVGSIYNINFGEVSTTIWTLAFTVSVLNWED